VSAQASDTSKYSEDFLRLAKILKIPRNRWDEPVVQEGLPLLARAQQLQSDLSVAKLDIFRDGVTFGTEEVLMRCVCALLEDKITGKPEHLEYIKGKMAACGYERQEES
jgi:hypothetical protein